MVTFPVSKMYGTVAQGGRRWHSHEVNTNKQTNQTTNKQTKKTEQFSLSTAAQQAYLRGSATTSTGTGYKHGAPPMPSAARPPGPQNPDQGPGPRTRPRWGADLGDPSADEAQIGRGAGGREWQGCLMSRSASGKIYNHVGAAVADRPSPGGQDRPERNRPGE